MSYLTTKSSRRPTPARVRAIARRAPAPLFADGHAKRSRSAVGDIMDDLKSWVGLTSYTSPEVACLDEANAQVAALDGQRAVIAAWTPPAYLKPDDMSAIIARTMTMISSASDVVAAAPRSAGDSEAMIQDALSHLYTSSTDSTQFIQAIAQAKASGALVTPDGLQAWIVSAMGNVSSALVTASVMTCDMTWLATQIIAFQAVFNDVATGVTTVAGAVLAAGQAAVSAVTTTAKVMGYVIQAAPFAAAAYLLYVLLEPAHGRAP